MTESSGALATGVTEGFDDDPSRNRVDRGMPQELIDTGNLSGVTTSQAESPSTVRKDSR
jgi:hypothetical protein